LIGDRWDFFGTLKWHCTENRPKDFFPLNTHCGGSVQQNGWFVKVTPVTNVLASY